MKRRLFTILWALSLLLFVAVVTLWTVNYDSFQSLGFRAGARLYLIMPRPGGVYVAAIERYPPSAPQHDPYVFTERPPDRLVGFRRGFGTPLDTAHDLWRVPGLRAGAFDANEGTIDAARVRYVMPSYGLFAAVLGVSSLGAAVAAWRGREPRADQCPSCGYDLRATPDRCPECGTAARDRIQSGSVR